MKVHYKPKMVNKILEAQIAAKSIGEKIDYIEVSDREWASLLEEMRAPFITGGTLIVHGVEVAKLAPTTEDDDEELF